MSTKWGIKETGTVFEIGSVFRPSWDDVRMVVGKMYDLGLIKDLVPEVNISVILAHGTALRMAVPLILERSDLKDYKHKAPKAVQAYLWVLACFWHIHGGGPRPATKAKRRYRKRGATLEFRCPYCARVIYEPNPRFKSRGVIIKQFANALTRHAEDCDDLLYLDRSVTK